MRHGTQKPSRVRAGASHVAVEHQRCGKAWQKKARFRPGRPYSKALKLRRSCGRFLPRLKSPAPHLSFLGFRPRPAFPEPALFRFSSSCRSQFLRPGGLRIWPGRPSPAPRSWRRDMARLPSGLNPKKSAPPQARKTHVDSDRSPYFLQGPRTLQPAHPLSRGSLET